MLHKLVFSTVQTAIGCVVTVELWHNPILPTCRECSSQAGWLLCSVKTGASQTCRECSSQDGCTLCSVRLWAPGYQPER
jgi:hypothetical protein